MKYKKEIYETMKEIYGEFLNDKDDENELIEMVDSYEPHELFKDLCEWHGLRPSLVEHVYEMFYGKGKDKVFGWFAI